MANNTSMYIVYKISHVHVHVHVHVLVHLKLGVLFFLFMIHNLCGCINISRERTISLIFPLCGKDRGYQFCNGLARSCCGYVKYVCLMLMIIYREMLFD